LDELDQLTVQIKTQGAVKVHRCAGEGCEKRWQPHARAQVLAHCKNCLKLTADDRQFTSTCSAKTSSSVLVEAGLNTIVKGKKGGKLISAVPRKATTSDKFFGPAGRSVRGSSP
jgi:hypothetical protein